MGISITVGYDAIHENVHLLPVGQAAGYTTGTSAIIWTPEDWAAHPTAVRICQDGNASDTTADVLDVENGAATLPDCATWAQLALSNFVNGTRVGQRKPLIYTSASNVTPVVNALIRGGVTEGVGLFVANWDLNETEAVAAVQAASGPFPIEAIQYKSMPAFDIDIFYSGWLTDVSAAHEPSRPFRLVASGIHSLASECEVYQRSLQSVIYETAIMSPGGFGPAQTHYFNGGNMNARMPTGMFYWMPAV